MYDDKCFIVYIQWSFISFKSYEMMSPLNAQYANVLSIKQFGCFVVLSLHCVYLLLWVILQTSQPTSSHQFIHTDGTFLNLHNKQTIAPAYSNLIHEPIYCSYQSKKNCAFYLELWLFWIVCHTKHKQIERKW